MRNMNFDIEKVPMVRVTWLDARDTETGWLPIKDTTWLGDKNRVFTRRLFRDYVVVKKTILKSSVEVKKNMFTLGSHQN